jgi:molybdenum cofactor biosynthesis protein B
MVDFQSRDTRRGLGGSDDDDDDDEGDEENVAEESVAESEDETPIDDESAESADAESTDDDEAVSEPKETTADESQGDATVAQQAADPLASGSESEDEPSERTDEQDAQSNTTQQTEAGPVGSKATAPKQDAPSAAQSPSVAAAVVTIGIEGDGDDPTSEQMVAALQRAGHTVVTRERLRGDFDGVQQSVDALVGREDVDVVVTAGGTGIKGNEIAIEAVHPLLEKALPGFGEAFRTLLFDHIGTGIVAVRTTAGVAKSTPVFCLPGDPEAAALGVEEIVAPEAGELVAHLEQE